MLTDKALYEQKWGWIPALGEILNKRKIPWQYFGPTSISDSCFESTRRLMEIMILIGENRDEISAEMTRSQELHEKIHLELNEVARALEAVGQDFLTQSQQVAELANKARGALCAYHTAPEDIGDSLIRALRVVTATATPIPPTLPKKMQSPIAERPRVSERAIDYSIFGEAKHAEHAMAALIDILRVLANRNPNFLEKVAELVPGTSRNHIAKRREDVYPGKPDLIEYTVQFVPGWWLGTNIANREKMRIIKQACMAEGLKLGRDIVITLPNAG